MRSVHLQGKPFNIMVIQVYDPTSNTEEAEVERFYEDLQDLLELTPKKDILFIIGDWNTKVGSQETPGLTGKNQMVNTEIRLIIFYAAKDGEDLYSQQKSPKCSTWMQSQKRQNDLCSSPRQTIQYHGNPSLCPNQ